MLGDQDPFRKVDFALGPGGFKVINQLSNFPNFPKIDGPDEFKQECYLCGETRGFKASCDFGNCPVKFHHRCGISQGII